MTFTQKIPRFCAEKHKKFFIIAIFTFNDLINANDEDEKKEEVNRLKLNFSTSFSAVERLENFLSKKGVEEE